MVDDNDGLRILCRDALCHAGWDVVEAATGGEALALVEREAFHVAVVDLVLPDMGGLSILSALRARDPRAAVILMTGFASLDSAVEAVRRGAYEYLRKPFPLPELVAVVGQACAAYETDARSSSPAESDTSETPSGSELDGLVRLTLDLQGALSPREVLARVAASCLQLTGADSSAVMALDRDTNVLRLVCAEGGLVRPLQEPGSFRAEGILADVIGADGPLCVPDLAKSPAAQGDPLSRLGIYSLLASPIRLAGEAQGVLLLMDKYHAPFSRQDEALAVVLAMHAAAPLVALRSADAALPSDALAGTDEFVALEDLFPRG